MVATANSLGPITIGTTTIATLGWSLSPDIVRAAQKHSGLPYPTLEVVPGANPRIKFRAYFQDIYAVIGSLTILNATIFNVYLSKYTSLIRDASAAHLKVALTASCVAAIQILSTSADQDGMLIAECEAIIGANDSSTHPFTITTNNALPALTAAPIIHTLGPGVLNGTGLPGVTSASLDCGQEVQVGRHDGDLYPRMIAQTGAMRKISCGHADPRGLLTALGLLGANITANYVQYFRRADATTGVVGAANGISMTVASGRVHPVDLTAAQGAIATEGFELVPLSATTADGITISLTATVPAAG